MVEVPEQLARSIQAGECVLWAGAGFGALAGRPGWEDLLRQLVPNCAEDAQQSLDELLEQGRLQTVLTYVHRHFGDEPLAQLLKRVSKSTELEFKDGAGKVATMPWCACFATTYADLLQELFAQGGRRPETLGYVDAHFLSLREQRELFILRTPPMGRTMRAHGVLFDLVEEVVRSRTVLFLGFEPDDPDLVQILEMFDRIGRGNQHFAVLPYVSAPEIEEWQERFSIQVLPAADDYELVGVFEDLATAAQAVPVRPSGVEGRLAILDLTRAVRGVNPRADLAVDESLTLESGWVEHLMDALPGTSLAGVSPTTLLQAGSVMLTHRRVDRARRCFQQVVSSGPSVELTNVARFNLALAALVEGDRTAALEGLSTCADADRSLAVVPPRFELTQVQGLVGTELMLTARDRSTKDDFDIIVSTLARPVGGEEQAAFSSGVQKLVGLEHPAICRARGGFADGRLFGVMYAPVPGFVLEDTLDREPMALHKAHEIIVPLLEGLAVCHAQGSLHRNVNPHHVVLAPDGAKLRGFGFPPVVGFRRPSVREVNLGYLAPEVRRDGDVTTACDVYGVGAVLYRCLTGRAPQGGTPTPTSFSEKLDPRVDELLGEVLHPDPQSRPSVEVFAQRLSHIVQTPDVGMAQKLLDEGAEDGHERVVDLGERPPAPNEQVVAQTRARSRTTGTHPNSARSEAQRADAPQGPPAPEPIAKAGEPPDTIAAPVTVKILPPQDKDDLEAWAWILERRPAHIEAREAINRIENESRIHERWDRVAEVLTVRAQYAQAQKERVAVLHELTELYEQKLEVPANAFETLVALIEEIPVVEQLEKLSHLNRLAEVTGRWSVFAKTLHAVAQRADDPDRQATLFSELGHIYAERLGANDQAIEAYEAAIGFEATADRVQAAVALNRKLGREAELAAGLLSLAELQEGEERHRSLFQAANLLREALEDEEGAFAILEVLLVDKPNDNEVLELAESLGRQLERWDFLVDVLERRADVAVDGKIAASLRREAAELALDRREDKNAAMRQLTKLVEADRTDVEAATKLVELLRSAALEDPSKREALIDALGNLAEATTDANHGATLRAEQAALLDEQPDGKARATACREAIIAIVSPDHPVWQAAAEALEVNYRRREDYRAVEAMLLRQANHEDADAQFRVAAWKRVLELRCGVIADDDGAVVALEALMMLEPQEPQWRDDLLERYMEREQYDKAQPIIDAQVETEQDPIRKAGLLLRSGILRHRIGSPEDALAALEGAVALDPSATQAWLLLRELYAADGQPLKSIEALVEAAEQAGTRPEQARMLFEAAAQYMGELDRPQRGAELLERVVELDPDHRQATSMLLDYLVGQDDLARAWPHARNYVMLVRTQQAGDNKLKLRALSLAGRCALAVHETEHARTYLQEAQALDASNLDLLRLLADLDLKAGRYSEALRNYQSAVLGLADTLSPADLSSMYVRMGQARLGLEEKSKAAAMFERALDVDKDNEPAASKLVALAPDLGPEAVVKAKRRLSDLLERRAEQLGEDPESRELRQRQNHLLDEIAQLELRELERPQDAVLTLEKMLELNPDDQGVMHRILDVYTETQRWDEAIDILARLADSQTSDSVRAKYLYAGAVILRDNVADIAASTEWMRRVVDADPQHEKAFSVYIEQLRKQANWHDLSRAIRGHLKALPKGTPARRHVELFHALGEAHEKMKDAKTALAAYDQAARLAAKTEEDEATQTSRRMKVMRLAVVLGEGELDKAISHGHAIITGNPMDFETYHRLVELYLKQGRRDRARAVARTLRFLKQADEAELELAEGSKAEPQHLRGTISRDQWRRSLYHPYEDPRTSELFSIIWPMVAAREGHTHEHHGVTRDSRTDVTLQAPSGFARFLAHACQVLDTPVPDLYLRHKEAGGIVIDALASGANDSKSTVYPSVLAGKDALTDDSEVGLKFRAGRAVAQARPEHMLAAVLPSVISLDHALWGAIRLARGEQDVPSELRETAGGYARQILPYLQPARFEQLKALAANLRGNGAVDMRRWVDGVTFTTTRAGFVLCDRLDIAAQILSREGDEGSPIPAKERIRDLIGYSVSEPYLALRARLGLAH